MMKINLRIFLLSFALLGAAFVMPVHAQSMSLQQAQEQGLVGERTDGYVGIVKQAPGISRIVDDVNLKRRQLYREIARKNGIPLDAVEKLAAEKAVQRAGPGEYIQDARGNWVRKP